MARVWLPALMLVRRRMVLTVLLVLASVGLVPSVGGLARSQAQAQAAPAAQAQTTPPSFSGAAAKQQVEALGDQIGSRPAGSANYDQAAQYAADQLRQWGYVATLQTFPLETYEDHGSQVELISGGGGPLVADTLVYSVGGQVEAPLVAAGLGQPEDLAAVDVRGRIALIKRGTLRFGDKVANAARAGALGTVIYNESSGRLLGGSLGQSQAIPVAAISGDDGQRLADQLAGGTDVVVRLTVNGNVVRGSSTNVVAQKPGPAADAGTVVIGAHLDSVAAGPGANDNGSGAAVVLELARTLAQSEAGTRPYALTFVLFGAEEVGLYGSRYYVGSLSDAERRGILAMLNLDMVGVGQAWRFGGSDNLVQYALGAANELGERALPLRGPLGSASDHASFLSAGVPALFLYRTDDPNYHTANDRPEFVDADALGQAGSITLRVLDVLAGDQ